MLLSLMTVSPMVISSVNAQDAGIFESYAILKINNGSKFIYDQF